MVTINGKPVEALAGKPLSFLLAQYAQHQDNVVVELNGSIVHRNEIDGITLNPNDHVELISFVGGG